MSTPPNPPSTPPGPRADPAGAPAPETPSIPAPADSPSLEKPTAQAAGPAPEPAPAAGPPTTATPEPAPAPDPAPFAPVAPAPPADPYATPAAPAAPGGAWPPPGPDWAGAPYGYPAPQNTNGLAVAALVLGLLGLAIGPIPVVFWFGGLLAVIGIGIGIGAVVRSRSGAPRGTMAVVGTGLAVLGLGASVGGYFLTGAVFDRIDRRLDREYRQGIEEYEDHPGLPTTRPAPRPSPSPSQVPGLTSALPFGETFTYPDGVKVSLSKPEKYVTKNQYAKVGNAVQTTVTITNDSPRTINVIYALPNLRAADGMTAKPVFDGSVPKMISGDILPGASASGVVAFEVPEGTEEVTADITPGGLLPAVKYTGAIG
ncbi:DUF4352 domain-containing protein [Streptomyces sp. NPDC060031]|uniref:DUF4352 domain-containing protein n=1 Tax=Streptomyces sp. NPDC060031 TaxID=3347043 RepID=UPI0036B9F180